MSNRQPLSFYIPSLKVGGAQRVTVTIANGLATRGHDVHLVLSFATGAFLENLSTDVEVVDLGTPRIPGIGIGASIPALISYLNQRSPAALFSQMMHANVVCLAAHRLADSDTAMFPTEHNTFGMKGELKERLTYRLAEKLYSEADQIIAVSEGVAASIIEETPLQRDTLTVLYNPVNIEAVREQSRAHVELSWFNDRDIQVILFVGHMHPQKDLETWVKTFAKVVERRGEVRGIIAGQGPQRKSAIALAESLGVRDRLLFPGYIENAYAYMSRADVFLLSSRYEGLPTVLIEALACGCPIVSTDCPSGPREILEDGKYGQLAPPRDPFALADETIKLLESSPNRTELVRRADEFSPEIVIERYESFLQEHGVFA